MPNLTIDDDIDVEFPFQPYDVQLKLMTCVVRCLKNRENGLLESPTGTGKTLALLCASLGWQKLQRSHMRDCITKMSNPQEGLDPLVYQGGVPKIIYSSRTHSQLSQAVQALKKSAYKRVKSVTLGSRDLLCIHPVVSKIPSSSVRNTACHVKVQRRVCSYYNEVSRKKEGNLFESSIVDIEDLVTRGSRIKFCPFFMSKELVKDAEIIFMPYNYLLDPKIRTTQGIDIKNSVVILDEGHNISRMCEEAVSFEIRSTVITTCINEMTEALTAFAEGNAGGGEGNALTKELSVGVLTALKNSFLQLELKLQDVKGSAEGVLHPAHVILLKLFESGFNPFTVGASINALDVISSFLADRHHDMTACEKFGSILRVLNSQASFIDPHEFGKSYKVFVEFEKKSDASNPNSPKTFKFWCFNPALGLQTLTSLGPRCVILASGTLSPIPFLVQELGIPFPVQLSNPHIIGDNQLFACLMSHGPGNTQLQSTFQNRSNEKYLYSMGSLIVDVCARVPNGVLVFFPSYTLMDFCQSSWTKSGIMTNISSHKKLLIEPKGKDTFHHVITSYYEAAKTGSGGCLMAVCRGKVAEGLDFSNEYGRAVIIIGIPYAPIMDPQIKAKKEYLEAKLVGNSGSINGRTWYQMEAIRALNQAIGRIIRHANDYGAILLCDSRCGANDVKGYLSEWVKSRLKSFPRYEDSIRQLTAFFGSSVYQKSKNVLNNNGALAIKDNGEASTQACPSSSTIFSPSLTRPMVLSTMGKKLKIKRKSMDFSSTSATTSVKQLKKAREESRFTSVTEFWNWVRLVLTEERLGIFQKATRLYTKEKEREKFSSRLVKLFPPEHFDTLEEGFKLLIFGQEYDELIEAIQEAKERTKYQPLITFKL